MSAPRPKLTKAQQDALDDLANDLQRAFVFEIVMDPKANGTAAAKAAGYGGDYNTLAAQASNLLKQPKIQAAIRALREPGLNRKYRGVEELRELWDAWIDETGFEPKDRIKASELLGKSQAAFIEHHKVEVTAQPASTDAARKQAEEIVAALGGTVTWGDAMLEDGDGEQE